MPDLSLLRLCCRSLRRPTARKETPGAGSLGALHRPLPSDDGGKGGVSSFAYQGTNSHVTVGAPQHCHALVVCPQRFWDLRKFWFQVRTPPQSISGFRNACVFS